MTQREHPPEAGLSKRQLDLATALLQDSVGCGFVPGLVAAVYRNGRRVRLTTAGTRQPDRPELPVERDTIFLVASLTKPIVCAGALLLLQRGEFALDQRVCRFLPAFRGGGREDVLIRHLLTHTSGLPDQLPLSRSLRAAHAPIDEFVRQTCQTELLFAPGSHISYQSMGILLVGAIIEGITGRRLRDFLGDELFKPLGMVCTTLGMPRSGMKAAAYSLPAPSDAESNDVGTDWNTEYWRDFGVPWGGLHTTAEDLGQFLMHVGGMVPGPLSASVRHAMTTDQTSRMTAKPREGALSKRWGLGFMIDATGAMYWVDPDSGVTVVLLTNQPSILRSCPQAHQDLFPRYSNLDFHIAGKRVIRAQESRSTTSAFGSARHGVSNIKY